MILKIQTILIIIIGIELNHFWTRNYVILSEEREQFEKVIIYGKP